MIMWLHIPIAAAFHCDESGTIVVGSCRKCTYELYVYMKDYYDDYYDDYYYYDNYYNETTYCGGDCYWNSDSDECQIKGNLPRCSALLTFFLALTYLVLSRVSNFVTSVDTIDTTPVSQWCRHWTTLAVF